MAVDEIHRSNGLVRLEQSLSDILDNRRADIDYKQQIDAQLSEIRNALRRIMLGGGGLAAVAILLLLLRLI